MAPDPGEPASTPITTFSPSEINDLVACPLRVAFGRDPASARLKRPGVGAILGTVAHAVFEELGRRSRWPDDPSERRAAIEAIWDEREEAGRAKLAAAWSPVVPPAPESWPGYQLKRVRTVRRALKRLDRATELPPDEPERATPMLTDDRLEDRASGLVGYPDLVREESGLLTVVDFKTGLAQGEPTEGQRRQLLLYAVLVQRWCGRWPDRLEVEDLTGDRWPVDYTPLAAEVALREAEDAVTSLNSAIEQGAVATLACPEPETCRWCPYRTRCGPYWDALKLEWEHRSVRGTIVTAVSDGELANVAVRIESPRDAMGEVVRIGGLRGVETAPDEGAVMSLVDLVGSVEDGNLRAVWSTMFEIRS